MTHHELFQSLLKETQLSPQKLTQILFCFFGSIFVISCDRTAIKPTQVTLTLSDLPSTRRENLDDLQLRMVDNFLIAKIDRNKTRAGITQKENALTDKVGRNTQKSSYSKSLELNR